jgi:hypothetical protein
MCSAPREPDTPPEWPRWLPQGPLVALLFLVWSAWLLGPALIGGEHVLAGLAGLDSDVIRGAWSLEQVARGLPDPIHTHRVFFPVGIQVVPLPFASALLLAPLQLLGPMHAYDLSLLALLVAAGWSTAWLGRELTGSWALGSIAGGTVLAQPLLMDAIADGTPEHLAIWSLPAVLAAAWRSLRTGSLGWALATAPLLLVLLLDSPYMAVYGLVIAPFFLAAALLWRPDGREPAVRRLRPLLVAALAGLPAVALLAWLYRDLPLQPQDFDPAVAAFERAGNSAKLRTWLQLSIHPGSDVRGNLVPALIPVAVLVPALLLALAAIRRSWPWLLASGLMILLALGTADDNPVMFAWWMKALFGSAGESGAQGLSAAVVSANEALQQRIPFSGIRFPRRWLLPAALFLCMAGSLGLGRLLALVGGLSPFRRQLRRWPLLPPALGLALGPVLAVLVLLLQPYLQPRATTAYPTLGFTAWLAEQPGEGAVLTLPTERPGKPNTHRWQLPAYANISNTIRSSECLYFQLEHGRPVYCYPSLLTAKAAAGLDEQTGRLIRDANELTRPATLGEPPSESAYWFDGKARRDAGRAWLVERGLRFVVLDLSVYQGEWLDQAVSFWEPLANQRRFDDGAGVLVLELER